MSEINRSGYRGDGSGTLSASSPTTKYPRPAAGTGGWDPPPGGYWPPPAPPSPKQHPQFLPAALLVAALVAAVAVGVGHTAWPAASPSRWALPWEAPATSPPAAPPAVSPSGSSLDPPSGSVDLSALAARVDPALVDINTWLGYHNAAAAGTGIVLSSSGEVLTNNHVIAGATSIDVTDVGNGQTYPATVVGYDRSHDIAVLHLHGAAGLQTASIGDSDSVAVGDQIAAIGNAGGRGGTPSITAGTVSALDRTITVSDETTGSAQRLAGLIQVAADVEPGDSGGPLVNTTGQVIGVNTAGSGRSQDQFSGGDGLAIPINDAIAISKQIEAGISSTTTHIGPTGILGIAVQESTAQARSGTRGGFGNPYGSVPSGAVVAGVTPGSPGDQAGLTASDVIVSLDATAVDSPATLTTLLTGHHPGDLVTLEWVDSSGQQQNATVRLATGPPN